MNPHSGDDLMHDMNDYSSAIQLRSDRWSALREATSALTRDPKPNEVKNLSTRVQDLFTSLALIEPYWAFPGMAAFDHMRRQFQHNNLDDLVSKRIPLEEVNQAFEDMEKGEVARSVILFD